jgi:hypothetical protein
MMRRWSAMPHDAYFEIYKKEAVIGPRFVSPVNCLPGAQTVISYFLPFAREIRKPNRRQPDSRLNTRKDIMKFACIAPPIKGIMHKRKAYKSAQEK